MVQMFSRRALAVVALLLSAVTLSACGCGPFGLNYCGGRGGYDGGYGGGHGHGHGGGGRGPYVGGGGGWGR